MKRSTKDKAKGRFHELKGKVKEKVGGATNNPEGQWDRGDDVSTENLRLALRRYRSFFGRLLSV